MGTEQKYFVLNPDIVFREEEDGAFLFNPETDALHCLNSVGASICKLCHHKNTLADIRRSLSEEYHIDVGSDQLVQDITDFIHRLVSLNLIKAQE